MQSKFLLPTLIFLFSLAQASAQSTQSVMTNAHVIKLVKSGLDEDIIITTIESASGKYDVTTDGLVSLKTAGVRPGVIKSMIAKMDGNKSPKTPKNPVTPATTSTSRIPEPELINTIYSFQKANRSLKLLEKANAIQKVHKAGLGYGATTFTCEISGDKSGMRLSPEEAESFVINTGGAAPDAIILFKVEVKKKLRSAITSKVTGMGSMKGSLGSVACNVKQLKTGVFEIAPASKLEKGEYFFTTKQFDYTTMANMDVYAFAVD